jgi:hypothetical protein
VLISSHVATGTPEVQGVPEASNTLALLLESNHIEGFAGRVGIGVAVGLIVAVGVEILSRCIYYS